MKTLLPNHFTRSAAIALSLLTPLFATAQAQTALTGTLAGQVRFSNDVRERGLSQNLQQPALSATLDYGFPVGFYVGTEWRNVSERIYAGANTRVDLYGGFRADYSPFSLDIGTRYQSFSNAQGGYLNLANADNQVNLHEFYLGVKWLYLSAKGHVALSKFHGLYQSQGSSYLEVAVSPELTENVNLIAHAGYQKVKGWSQASYSDYSLGVVMQLNKTYSLSVTGVGSNANDSIYKVLKNNGSYTNIGKSGLVLSLGAQF